MIFQEKYFLAYILSTDQISLSGCFYFEILDNMRITFACYPVCDVINFEINLFSNQPVFIHDQTVQSR